MKRDAIRHCKPLRFTEYEALIYNYVAECETRGNAVTMSQICDVLEFSAPIARAVVRSLFAKNLLESGHQFPDGYVWPIHRVNGTRGCWIGKMSEDEMKSSRILDSEILRPRNGSTVVI